MHAEPLRSIAILFNAQDEYALEDPQWEWSERGSSKT